MEKNEFINILEQRLLSELSRDAVAGQVQYYRDYISQEMSRGKTEQEVMAELGDPRLIAKTIIDSNKSSYQSQGVEFEECTEKSRHREKKKSGINITFNNKKMSSGFFKVMLIVIGIVICVVAFSLLYLVMRVLGFVFQLIAPFVGVVLLVWIVYRLMRKK